MLFGCHRDWGCAKMRSDKRIAVLAGGISSEAQVSRSSGACVAEALRESFADVQILDCLPRDLPRELALASPDCVFSCLHGGFGENGTVSGLLAMLEVPFVGSGLAASVLAMDKAVAKLHFQAAGLPVLPDILCESGDDLKDLASRAVRQFPEGGVVKASSQGSAIGLGFCNTEEEYLMAIADALTFGDRVLVERRFFGREISVGLLDTPDLSSLPVVEVLIPDGGHFDYIHRYTGGAAIHVCPAEIAPETRARIVDIALRAHRALGCRHYSRVDMLLDTQGEIALLELNTIPGMTKTSLYPDSALAAGMTFDHLVKHLVDLALADGPLSRAAVRFE